MAHSVTIPASDSPPPSVTLAAHTQPAALINAWWHAQRDALAAPAHMAAGVPQTLGRTEAEGWPCKTPLVQAGRAG